ncbi:MAG: YqjK-like family protein [Sterolibacterium sp.]|jgi:hypothetical protein|nr:YqjK-like family protein [Sterolibacterium sp.]MBP9799971.1 YqjK-like family protein [Sterolibacterium sp.]
MDTERRIELALRKQRLLLKSASLRLDLANQVGTLSPAFAAVDRLRAAGRWLRRHPQVPVAVLTALLVARPRAVFRWAQRGWFLWQVVRRWRHAEASAASSRALLTPATLSRLLALKRWF